MLSNKPRTYILPTIIIAQFACTSTWFAGNVILESLTKKIEFKLELIGWVLSSVQLGFIAGTLLFGLLMIADRFSPSKVFMICGFLVAAFNLTLISPNLDAVPLLLSRFATGFFLAGIYPVGMKIASDYFEKGLGEALGYLVGALVIGSAFPYLLSGTDWGNHPETVVKTTSLITALGGLLLFILVPNGPYRVASRKIKLGAGLQLFKNKRFRKSAFGYFGHMWELYAFWAFLPIAISWFNSKTGNEILVPLWTGIIIGLGGISCAVGGRLSLRIGSRKVAIGALIVSGLFCLISPLLYTLTYPLFLTGLCFWGVAVTADSPQLSKLIANSITSEVKGTALTFSTCIGFALTILSIQLLTNLQFFIPGNFLFIPLTIGPAIGVWQLWNLKND